MVDKIRPEYRGKCLGYLVKFCTPDVEAGYSIATLVSLEQTKSFFLYILVNPYITIIKSFNGVRDLQSDSEFNNIWISHLPQSDR